MNELRNDFMAVRDMSHEERETWLHGQVEWQKIMREYALQSPCFRTSFYVPVIEPATRLAGKVMKNKAARYKYAERS